MQPMTYGVSRCAVDAGLVTPGSLESVCANKDQSEFFYKFTSFNDPGTVFRAVVTPAGADHAPKVESQVRFRSDIPGLDPNDFETTQVRRDAAAAAT